MSFIDYYKILGIEKTASPKDVKNAYRKLARKFHPDLNPNAKDAQQKFQQINEANEVLSDPMKRKKFDEYGENWKYSDDLEKEKQTQRHQQQKANSQNQQFSYGQSDDDFSDFFASLFGQTSSGNKRQTKTKFRGDDYKTELHLELIDAYTTHKQTLNVNGKNIRITVPAGIENGQTIKIFGHGGEGKNGGQNGDLYIGFVIANHPHIKRVENNLYLDVDLDFYVAILGGEITIDTLSGKVKLKIKPETQNGSKVKLKGKGFPFYKSEGKFGDLYVTYSIKMPTNLSEKQKTLFTELSKL